MSTPFNLLVQQDDLPGKIVIGLERISEIYRILLWKQAKTLGLSPIQIQIMIFISYHELKHCTVSHLALEFGVTKPTISDAVKVLVTKTLIQKRKDQNDARGFSLSLTGPGKKIVEATEQFANPIYAHIQALKAEDQSLLLKLVSNLIFSMNQAGIIQVQRTCRACQFYESDNGSYCALLKKKLADKDIRLDCPEFVKI